MHGISVRANIELYRIQDEAQVMNVLIDEYNFEEHTRQADAYILKEISFLQPNIR
jgi:hypothetical protein